MREPRRLFLVSAAAIDGADGSSTTQALLKVRFADILISTGFTVLACAVFAAGRFVRVLISAH